MGGPLKSMGGFVKNIFAPEIPKPEKAKPVFMPDPEAARAAAKKKLTERAQKGREGTIFSDRYSGTNLGGTG